MRRIFIAALAGLALSACQTGPEPGAPAALEGESEHKFTLAGDFTREDFQTYREIPFAVPRGVTSLRVELTYDRANNTVIDMGLRDPRGQRGWSGAAKSIFTITEFEATPSYFPGRIQPGEWRLVLGVPNIREGVTSHYQAIVTLGSGPVFRPPTSSLASDRALSRGPDWRRGDFHMHTGHSDGSCDDGGGKREPCPIERTVVASRAALLDFIAITDHNTLSHRDPMRRLQTAFPGMLLIPGTEITTYWGHANAIGLKQPLEFALGSVRLPEVGELLDSVDAQGAILSINHPKQPSGEACMGCAWTAPNTQFARIAALEVVNGASLRAGSVEGPTSGLSFWESKLEEGLRITGVGGSDNHDPADREGARQAPVGKPTTVVWAKELSTRGILEGVRSGRVFIDLANTPGAVLDLEGRSASQIVAMGGVMELGPEEQAHVFIKASGVTGGRTAYVSRGLATLTPSDGPSAGTDITVQLSPEAAFGWIRAEVRNAQGDLMLVSNPVYVQARREAPPALPPRRPRN